MRLILTLLLIILAQIFLSAETKAQTQAPACPSFAISCPTDTPEPGKPIVISVNVSGGDRDVNPTYKWQVSAGKIISGQGTPQISVDTSDLAGQGITATVEIDGFPIGCDKTESCSLIPYERAPEARKYDQYSGISWTSEKTHLVNFGTRLQEEPGAQGYIIVYGPRRVKQHLERSQKFIVEKYGIDPQRITQVNGGSRKRMAVELWIVPIGAAPPKPTPKF